MITFNRYKDVEEKLRKAAIRMPEPTKNLPLSPVMEKRRLACSPHSSHGLRMNAWRRPAWRIAVLVLLALAAGSTTILAASSDLRTAIVRFFSSGTTETIPLDDLESKKPAPAKDSAKSRKDSSELSGDVKRQTVGSLTLVQDVTLDSHFTASYVSSPDRVALEKTSSGMSLFHANTEGGKAAYYSAVDGELKEISLKKNALTATVRLGKLPGVMAYHGNSKKYQKLVLPAMKFTVKWREYGSDILIDSTDSERGFNIGSTYGIDLKHDFSGRFEFQALPGSEDIVEVLFALDEKQTSYQYPFLLDLNTGKLSDPLAQVDLSDWACITDLSIQADLTTATAMAGSSHEDLQEITIDLNTGAVTMRTEADAKPPVDDYVTKFAAGKDALFYVAGTEESGDGYLYNTKTGESTVLFTDAADYSLWGSGGSSTRYWYSIGYGYLVYYADDKVFLINLHDGGKKTMLKGVSMEQDMDFFMNNEGTVLSISTIDENSFDTVRLCFIDLKTMKAWYFHRNLPEGVEEQSHCWNGEYRYVIEAQNTETGMNYIYMYQYAP